MKILFSLYARLYQGGASGKQLRTLSFLSGILFQVRFQRLLSVFSFSLVFKSLEDLCALLHTSTIIFFNYCFSRSERLL